MYIWNYNSVINYNKAYNKAMQKYIFKVFYNKINKKEYNLLIWEYNIYQTNIIVMKNIIILKKTRGKKTINRHCEYIYISRYGLNIEFC